MLNPREYFKPLDFEVHLHNQVLSQIYWSFFFPVSLFKMFFFHSVNTLALKHRSFISDGIHVIVRLNMS